MRRHAWLFGAVALLATLLAATRTTGSLAVSRASVASVAVLPFADLSPGQDQGYFADGMTDALIADLAQIEALHVISRTSAMQYKSIRRPIPEIARELGVDAVVEGSVLADGDQVRIGVSLVDGRTDQTLWAHKYDRESRSILALQREVALAISREIRIKLAQDDQTYLHQAPSVVPEAYRLYLKGMQLRYKDSPEDWQQAADSFRQATALDPSFAPAYAELARVCTLLGGFTPLLTREKATAEGRQAIAKALQHDPNLSDAYGVKGIFHEVLEWDWTAAEQAFKRAIELNPGNSQARYEYGWLLTRVGRFEEALPQFKYAIQQDPRAALMYHSLAHVYLYRREYDQAIEHFQTALHLDPGYGFARSSLGQAYLLSSREDKALVELEADGVRVRQLGAGIPGGCLCRRRQKGAVLRADRRTGGKLEARPGRRRLEPGPGPWRSGTKRPGLQVADDRLSETLRQSCLPQSGADVRFPPHHPLLPVVAEAGRLGWLSTEVSKIR